MVRIAAVALLAFAVSALAAPAEAENGTDSILDFEGNFLSEAKLKEFLKQQEVGESNFAKLVASYTKEQQELSDKVKAASEAQAAILGPKKSDDEDSTA